MDAIELNMILQSDMKLWEMADRLTTTKQGQLVVKTELPHGIGEFVITFEGVTDGIKRRAAAEEWGANVRAAVDEAIGEESVTARAQQAAARVGRDTDQLHDVTGYDPEGPETVPDGPPVQAYEEAPDSAGESIASRYDRLKREAEYHLTRTREIAVELKALAAYMEVMNAIEVPEATTDDAKS